MTVTSPVPATEVLLDAEALTVSADTSAPLCPTVTFTTGSPTAPTAPDRYDADRLMVGVPYVTACAGTTVTAPATTSAAIPVIPSCFFIGVPTSRAERDPHVTP